MRCVVTRRTSNFCVRLLMMVDGLQTDDTPGKLVAHNHSFLSIRSTGRFNFNEATTLLLLDTERGPLRLHTGPSVPVALAVFVGFFRGCTRSWRRS